MFFQNIFLQFFQIYLKAHASYITTVNYIELAEKNSPTSIFRKLYQKSKDLLKNKMKITKCSGVKGKKLKHQGLILEFQVGNQSPFHIKEQMLLSIYLIENKYK